MNRHEHSEHFLAVAVPRRRGDEPIAKAALRMLSCPFPAGAGMNRQIGQKNGPYPPFPAGAGMNRLRILAGTCTSNRSPQARG